MNEKTKDAAQSAADDKAYARLEKDLTAVKNDIAHLSQQIYDAVNALGAVAQGQARRGLRNARANVDSVMSDASDRAGEVANAAQDAVSSSDSAHSLRTRRNGLVGRGRTKPSPRGTPKPRRKAFRSCTALASTSCRATALPPI